MSTKHAKTLAVAEDAESATLGPAAWNEDHALPAPYLLYSGNAIDNIIMTIPLGTSEMNGRAIWRTRVDLTNAEQARLRFYVKTSGGSATPVASVEYSTDGNTWNGIANLYVGMLGGSSSNTVKDSGWVSLPSGAKALVYLRVIMTGGDATTFWHFGPITVWAR